MLLRRRSALVAAIALAIAPVAIVAPGSAGAPEPSVNSTSAPRALISDHRRGRSAPARLSISDPLADTWVGRSYATPRPKDAFRGIDGLWHHPSPVVVPGRNGTDYYGGEMDAACAWGKKFALGIQRLTRLAHIIEASGRRVLFTVGPNKSAVNQGDLPRGAMPHGDCDLEGIRQQDAVLDGISDPAFLPMRRELAQSQRAGQQMYWHIDTHWGTLSTTLYAQRLASRLSPRVARVQSYARREQTIYVDLNYIGAMDGVYETQFGRVPTTKVTVTPEPGSLPYKPDSYIAAEHEWTTAPARKTWRGNTLILGDSFSYRALGSLMPLFRHGDFQWYGVVPQDDTLEALRRADTVVLEVVQRSVPVFMTSRRFRRAVAKALGPHG